MLANPNMRCIKIGLTVFWVKVNIIRILETKMTYKTYF